MVSTNFMFAAAHEDSATHYVPSCGDSSILNVFVVLQVETLLPIHETLVLAYALFQ
jgi:hypothetical protein